MKGQTGHGEPSKRAYRSNPVKYVATLPVSTDDQAWLYITKAFKDYTPHVLGAMRLVAKSHDADELNRFGMGMYVSIIHAVSRRSGFIFGGADDRTNSSLK